MTDTLERPVKFHRPYARKKGVERSVTTIIARKAIDGLSWGAARETAIFAYFNQDKWTDLPADQAIDLLRVHHRGVWDGKAAMGTLVHAVNESWCLNDAVVVEDVVADMIANDRQARTWANFGDQITAQAEGYIDGLEAFWNEHQPSDHHTEEVVRTPKLYIGTSDWRCDLTWRDGVRCPTRLDIKTTAEQDGEKGLYRDSWGMQLAAYDRAEQIVYYAPTGRNGAPQELSTGPNVRAERCGVVHLRGEGHFELVEVPADDATFEAFKALIVVDNWLRKIEKESK